MLFSLWASCQLLCQNLRWFFYPTYQFCIIDFWSTLLNSTLFHSTTLHHHDVLLLVRDFSAPLSSNLMCYRQPSSPKSLRIIMRLPCCRLSDWSALFMLYRFGNRFRNLYLILLTIYFIKGITVGGSLQGLAAESTSFKYGFVHDAIIGFEAVLTNGTVLWCSPQCNSELFYSLPGKGYRTAIISNLNDLFCYLFLVE